MNNQPKKATFKYKQERRFCIGVAKLEGKDGTITWKRFWCSIVKESKLSQYMLTEKKSEINSQE